MAIFNLGKITFSTIKNLYETNLKCLNPDVITKNKGGKGSPLAFYQSRIYKVFLSSMYKALNTLEKGKSQQYYKYVTQSKGDYLKRKGGNVAIQMISHAEFIDSFIKKYENKNLQYSLLGIFTNIWDILRDNKWKATFKRAFSYTDTVGQTNTLVTSFKMMYIALVIAFETIGLKMLSFEYDVHTGINPEAAIIMIMNQHSSFMKSVVIPIIRIICICQVIKDPVKMLDEIISSEEIVNKAKKKASESGEIAIPGLSALESYKIEQFDNKLQVQSREGAGVTALSNITLNIIKFLGLGAGETILAGFATLAFGEIAGIIALLTVTVIIITVAVPVARLTIYWVNMKKVDLQKELEMQAELLNNNILSLQEKLEKTSDDKERARLQNIINKQIALLTNIQNNIKKYLDEEYEASVSAQQQLQSDDNYIESNSNNEGGYDDDDFEIEI
jgi:hypothetical protein